MAVEIYRRSKILEVTGWSISTLYEKMADGLFPKPIKLDPGGRAVGWLKPEVDQHQEARIAARDSERVA